MVIEEQFPYFHLGGKMKLVEGGIDRPLKVYVRGNRVTHRRKSVRVRKVLEDS